MFKPLKPAALLLAILLLLILGSCNKDKTAPEQPYGISVDIDGTKTTFNEMAEAHLINEQGLYRLDVIGYKNGLPNLTTSLSFTIVNTNNVGEGTYIRSDSAFPSVSMSYKFFITPNVGTSANSFSLVTHPTTITVTHVSATTVEGTFSGDLLYSIDGSNNLDTITLTNGAFRLKY